MKFSMHMTIDYYQPNEASLSLESDDPAQAESFGEILLFCCFTLRLLVDFGQSDSGYALAMSLFEVSDNLEKANDPNVFNAPKIVEYKGIPGQKQFTARLVHSKKRLNLKISTKGFSFFKSDLDFYSINSVMLFLSYLVNKRINDPRYMMKLAEVVKKCAQVFVSRQLSKKNEKQMALVIAGIVADL